VLEQLEERLGLVVCQPAQVVGAGVRTERDQEHVRCVFDLELSQAYHGRKTFKWSIRVIWLHRSQEFSFILTAASQALGRELVLPDGHPYSGWDLPAGLPELLQDISDARPTVLVLPHRKEFEGRPWDTLRIKGIPELKP
jgi:hypothetical protein